MPVNYGVIVRSADLVELFLVAVMRAMVFRVTRFVETLKVTVVAPTGTVTKAGTVA